MSERRQHFYTPPHSLEAERALIGGFIIHPSQLSLVTDKTNLKPNQFYLPLHQHVMQSMLDLDNKKLPIDICAIVHMAADQGADASHVVPELYLADLMERASPTQGLEHYALIVKQKYHLRRIIDICQTTIQHATKAEDPSRLLEDVERVFLEIGKDQDAKEGLKNAKEVLIPTLEILEQRISAGGKLTGVSSGFTELDHYTGGWQKSDLVILAARPGMGKTALALNWALNGLKYDPQAVIAVFTLEMSKEQLMERLLSSQGRIDSVKMRKGDLTDEDQDRLMHGAKEIHKLGPRLVIDETPGLSLSQLRSRCRRYQKEHGLSLIIIDYLQLMTASQSAQKQGREREIGEISMGLKSLAKELAVPVIAAAQLNRGPDSRPDKRPKISDLRESGSMEQDADMILFVYRDEYYNPNSEHAGKAEIIVAKNRHGETGSLYLAWLPNFVSFHNLL
jgi:replicative DNA helicase